jgi:DNA polymerase III epsilon subunit-like protein
MKARLIVLDTETGGLDPERHALLSLAAVDSSSGEAFVAIIRPAPEWLIEPEALAKNGFTHEFLEKNGRPERDVMEDLALWLAARRYSLLAGCNVAFDRDFLRAAFARHNIAWPLQHRTVDLQAAAWLAYEAGHLDLPQGKDGLPRLSLDHIAATLGHSRSKATHDALEDALLTLLTLERLISKTRLP